MNRRALPLFIAVLAYGLLLPQATLAAPGDLDQRFGTEGIAEATGSDGRVTDLATSPNGTIVTTIATSYGWEVARFTADGNLDATFGGDGVVTSNPDSSNEHPYGVAVQPDGKIVAVGSYGSSHNIVAIRYNTDGSQDASFATGGVLKLSTSAGSDDATAVAIQPDDKIVIVGQSNNSALVLRLTSTGTPDSSFDGDGIAAFDFPHPGYPDSRLNDLAIEADGDIVAAGLVSDFGDVSQMTMARLTAVGVLDATFDEDGMAQAQFAAGEGQGHAIGVLSDGSYVVGGKVGRWDGDMALAKFEVDGSPDLDFGFEGTGNYPAPDVDDGVAITGLVVLPGDRVIGVGWPGYESAGYLIAVNANGSPDPDFGEDGMVKQQWVEETLAIGLAADGKLLVGGSRYSSSGDTPIVLRYAAAPSAPRPNGLIAFSSNRPGNYEIYTMAQDGSGVHRLTSTKSPEIQPAWSPDGTMIAYARKVGKEYQIFTMNADGSNQTKLTNANVDWYLAPEWSPDGTRIYFEDHTSFSSYLYRMKADGTQETPVESGGDPSFSPDGAKIAFTDWSSTTPTIGSMYPNGDDERALVKTKGAELQPEWTSDGMDVLYTRVGGSNADIYTVSANGQHPLPLVRGKGDDWDPAASPDGTLIAFTRGTESGEIFISNLDGGGKVNLTKNRADDLYPAWQIGT